jgi:hypothetical protein
MGVLVAVFGKPVFLFTQNTIPVKIKNKAGITENK